MQIPSGSSYDEVAKVHFQSILASSQNYSVQISEAPCWTRNNKIKTMTWMFMRCYKCLDVINDLEEKKLHMKWKTVLLAEGRVPVDFWQFPLFHFRVLCHTARCPRGLRTSKGTFLGGHWTVQHKEKSAEIGSPILKFSSYKASFGSKTIFLLFVFFTLYDQSRGSYMSFISELWAKLNKHQIRGGVAAWTEVPFCLYLAPLDQPTIYIRQELHQNTRKKASLIAFLACNINYQLL